MLSPNSAWIKDIELTDFTKMKYNVFSTKMGRYFSVSILELAKKTPPRNSVFFYKINFYVS